jgi:Tfp pilus assembly protein PilE
MKALSKLTVVDVLVVIAILMILSAIVLPQFAQKYTKLSPGHRAHVASAVLTQY